MSYADRNSDTLIHCCSDKFALLEPLLHVTTYYILTDWLPYVFRFRLLSQHTLRYKLRYGTIRTMCKMISLLHCRGGMIVVAVPAVVTGICKLYDAYNTSTLHSELLSTSRLTSLHFRPSSSTMKPWSASQYAFRELCRSWTCCPRSFTTRTGLQRVKQMPHPLAVDVSPASRAAGVPVAGMVWLGK